MNSNSNRATLLASWPGLEKGELQREHKRRKRENMLSASALCCKMSLLIGQPWNINVKNERKNSNGNGNNSNSNNSNSGNSNMLLKANASNGNGQQWQTVNESSGRFRYEHRKTHQKAKRGAGKGLADRQKWGGGTDWVVCEGGSWEGVTDATVVCRLCRYVLQLANCTFMLTWRWDTPLGSRPPWLTDNINQSYAPECVCVCMCVSWPVLIGKLWQQPWEQPQKPPLWLATSCCSLPRRFVPLMHRSWAGSVNRG